MSLTARHLALQGFLLTPISMAVQGLLAIDEEVLPPAPVGNDDGFNPPIRSGTYKPAPLPRRHLRRKRQQDIIFLGR